MKHRRRARVALVNMPWSVPETPSIQCGLLKSALLREGHSVDAHYLNLELIAALRGTDGEAVLSLGFHPLGSRHLLLEWLFSAAAFGDDGLHTYFEAFPELDRLVRSAGSHPAVFEELRSGTLPTWVAHWAAAIDWGQYDLIGFTTTFQQTTAALAMARAIKNLHPSVNIVFGGASVGGVMGQEYLRAIPALDFVVNGEGDLVLPALVEQLLLGREPRLPGVLSRGSTQRRPAIASPVIDLDALPVPDYSDYFAALDRLGSERVLAGRTVSLLFESSRGCWWGQKHHCTFCGLNAESISYRRKSPEKVLGEIVSLVEEHGVMQLDAVDNILDYSTRSQLCALLATLPYDLQIFYEVKANMTKDQLAELAAAGIREVQPGIESLSTHMLTLMNKGTTLLTNVSFLKWAHFYGVVPQWHILTGFPQENESDYLAQADVIPKLLHLPPPSSCVGLWIDRFSPYFTDGLEGISNLRPRSAYRHVYPGDQLDLGKIAYYFDYEVQGLAPRLAYDALDIAVQHWNHRWETSPRPSLEYRRAPSGACVLDSRFGEARSFLLSDLEAAVYEDCSDSQRSARAVCARAIAAGLASGTDEVRAVLQTLSENALMLEEDGHYLSLALPSQDEMPRHTSVERE